MYAIRSYYGRAREAHDPELVAAVRRLDEGPGLLPGYVSELNMQLPPWLQGIAAALDRSYNFV